MTRRWRSAIRFLILGACVAAVVWLTARLGWRNLLETTARADPVWLALSLLPIAGRFMLWALKWLLMLRTRARITYRFALRSVLAGAFVNLTTPTAKIAGGLLRAVLVRRETGWRMSSAYGWALADQMTNTLGTLILVGLLSVGASFASGPDAGRPFLIGGLVALALACAMLLLKRPLSRLASHPTLAAWIERLTPTRFREGASGGAAGERMERLLEPMLEIRAGAGALSLDVGLSAAAFGGLCLANAMVLRALGADAPLVLVSACVAASYIAGTLTGTVGGIGATELALIELYALVGIPDGTATAGALLHRAGFYLVTAGWGGAALWWSTRGAALDVEESP